MEGDNAGMREPDPAFPGDLRRLDFVVGGDILRNDRRANEIVPSPAPIAVGRGVLVFSPHAAHPHSGGEARCRDTD